MQIEIEGQEAVKATEELLAIAGLEGNCQSFEEAEREGTLATIVAIVSIVSGTITIAKEIYEWYQKYSKSQGRQTTPRIDKVLIVGAKGRRLLLKNATVEQIQEILED